MIVGLQKSVSVNTKKSFIRLAFAESSIKVLLCELDPPTEAKEPIIKRVLSPGNRSGVQTAV